MAGADDYAAWIVKNENLKGTPQFDTVTKAYKEAVAEESLMAGQGEFSGESVLYPKEQVGVGRKLAQSGIKGVAGLADLVVGAPENIKRLGQYATTEGMPVPRMAAPIQTSLIEKGILKPEAEFNTPIGRVADFTAQLATSGGINPVTAGRSFVTKPLLQGSKDLARQAAMTSSQGLLGGGTSELLKSAGIESPVAQFLATSGAAAAGGAPFGLRSTPADIANKGLRNVNPEQLKMAQLLQKQAADIGSPITGAEAIAQVSGNKSLLGTQRFVENAQASQPMMNQFMANRPAGQEKAFRSSVEVMGAPPTSQTPFNLQQAGQQVVRGAEKGVTESVAPFYQKGVAEMQNLQAGKVLPIMPTEVTALQKNPAIDDAINHVIKNKYSGATGLSPNDPRTLTAAKVYLDAQYSKFSNNMTESFDKSKAANAWSGSRELDGYLSSKSPAYAQGSKNFEVAQKTQIGPMKAGPVGQIAEGKVTSETLMPQKPVNLYPEDIKRTADLLRRKDPTALPGWTRQNLESQFAENAQKLQGGENQFGGPKFAATIAGNKQQRDNLRTLVTESSGMQAWQGFEKFLDVMEAQGQRLPANSATTFNEMARQEMGAGLGTKLASPITPSRITQGIEQFQMGNNAKTFAKLLTDPDSVTKLEELARTGPRSAKTQALVNSLISGYISQKPEISQENK